MRWKDSKTQRTGAAILGVALILPLLTIPGADAATSDGKFLIKATSTKFFSTAGDGSKRFSSGTVSPGTDPSSGTSPVASPTSRKLDFSCGPLSYTIDQAKLDLGAANQKLHDQGKDSQMTASSEGWTGIYSYDPNAGGVVSGVPDPLPQIGIYELTASMTPRALADFIVLGSPQTKVRVLDQTTGTDRFCSILNVSKTAAAGDRYYFYSNKGGAYGEGRYESNGGKLYATVVTNGASTSASTPTVFFTRSLASNASTRELISDPSILSSGYLYSNGNKTGSIIYPTAADGYDRALLSLNQDGTRSVEYRLLTKSTNSSTDTPAKRVKGPYKIAYDSTGKLTALTYYKASTDSFVTLSGSSATVANYNSVTGQSWDGNYPKAESYDYSMPFQPTAP